MDAAVLFWTDADRRRMRMGEITAATRHPRRVRVDDPAAEPEEQDGAHAEAGEETEAQQKARVEREKAQWREEDKRRQNFEHILHERLSETRRYAAQNGIPQLTQLYKQQREMREVQEEKDEAATDVQTQLGASATQIQSLMAQARDRNVSWEYRRSVLSRARLAVSDHLAALHQIQDRCYDKFAEFAGKPEVEAQINAQMGDLDTRKRAMDEYYNVLERLASGDSNVGGLDRVAGRVGNVAPEIVRNSSAMRLLARRRRNFWAEIA
jgi:hypothetical protein